MLSYITNCINIAINLFQSEISESILSALITTSIPAFISVIGFVITIISVKRNFKNELSKLRSNIALEKMSEMPYQVLTLLDNIGKNKGNNVSERADNDDAVLKTYGDMINTVFSYGSKDAIEIVTLLQKESYIKGNTKNYIRTMATYVLLAMQIKFDVTGILISPGTYFSMKLNDYSTCKNRIKDETNKIINQLHLNKKFKISDD